MPRPADHDLQTAAYMPSSAERSGAVGARTMSAAERAGGAPAGPRVFIVARNPDPRSSLPYVLHLPLEGGGLWLKAKETWPRSSRVYCHPLDAPPLGCEILERIAVASCTRRGPAIDLVLERGLHKRSQFVFTSARGRPVILWQTPKAAQSAKPGLRIPTGRAHTSRVLYIDSRERYGYVFSSRATTERRPLPVGDYAAIVDGQIIAVVERKTIDDFATSLVDGRLGFVMAELATLPSAAIAIEGTYSALLRHRYTPTGLIPELLARLLIRYPHVSLNFLESRKVAQEWTYRYLLAAYANAEAPPLLPGPETPSGSDANETP